MGRKGRAFTPELEKTVEDYYYERNNVTWEQVVQAFTKAKMDVSMFMDGRKTFLDEPVYILNQLKDRKIDKYIMFIAELEDDIHHYFEIEKSPDNATDEQMERLQKLLGIKQRRQY